MDDEGDDLQGGDAAAEEESLVPDVITNEFFEEVVTRSTDIVKDLQGEQQYALAEDFQRLLALGSQLKKTLDEEQQRSIHMHQEVVESVSKVAAAMMKAQLDQDTITRLNNEIGDAWKQRDTAQMREQTAQDLLVASKLKVEQLKKELQPDGEDDAETEAKGKDVQDDIYRERDLLAGEVEVLETKLHFQRIYTNELQMKATELEKKNKELYKYLDETSTEAFKEKRAMDELKERLEATQDDLQLKTEEADLAKSQAETHNKNLQKTTQDLQTLRSQFEALTVNHNTLSARLTKTKNNLELIKREKTNIDIELKQAVALLQLKESESNKLELEVVSMIKKRESCMKKLMMTEMANSSLNQELTKSKNLIFTFEKEQDANKRAFDAANKYAEKLIRERDLMSRNLQKANSVIGDQADLLQLHEQHLASLQNEIRAYEVATAKQLQQIHDLEKDRDRKSQEIKMLNAKVEDLEGDIFLKNNEIRDLQNTLDETKKKLAETEYEYEITKTERNNLRRDLQALTGEHLELKEAYRMSMESNDQLREDIGRLEHELLQAGKHIDRLDKDKHKLTSELQQLNVQMQHTRTELKEKTNECARLNKIIAKNESDIASLNKRVQSLENDNGKLETTVTNKLTDIKNLNEIINTMQIALDRGETQYNERISDIKLLKTEVKSLMAQRNLLARSMQNTADQRQEVLQLNRELLKERVRAKALEEEMSTPMNIHRWRKLSGQDPNKMDLIEKIQTQQKIILSQSVMVQEKDAALKEAQEMYSNLKKFAETLPTQEIKKELNCTRRALTAKTKKLKALSAEVEAVDFEHKSKDTEIEDLKRCLLEAKQENIKLKKQKQCLMDERTAYFLGPSQLPGSPKKAATAASGYKMTT